jgi:Fe-S-cluster containining protein
MVKRKKSAKGSANKEATAVSSLPVVPITRGCGRCCMHMGSPPFLYQYRDDGTLRFNESIPRGMPAELLEEIRQYTVDVFAGRRENRSEVELPCFWLDQQTMLCRHYESRPSTCREHDCSENPDCLIDYSQRPQETEQSTGQFKMIVGPGGVLTNSGEDWDDDGFHPTARLPIQLRTIYEGDEGSAYLELLAYPEDGARPAIARTVDIHGMIPDYFGPQLALDLDNDGRPIGMKIMYPLQDVHDEEKDPD